MKINFSSKTLIALAVAVAAAAGYETLANEQPIPPPESAGVLPDNLSPASPVAQVFKLAQAGVDASVIRAYISNCPSAFNLDADKIIALSDAGLPSDLVNAMFAHDKDYLAALNSPASSPPPVSPAPPSATPAEDTGPPSAPPGEVTINYFNDNLAPYGQWVQVDGYGRCWRPTVVVYDSTWQPYCDHGRWVYSDCGWYWDSSYSWGMTFHYGRWFNAPHYGWCWWPDTVWAPSWVTWRSSSDYCGWAPLPPFTAYQPGIGFTYRGANVSVGFEFGLASSCFTFVGAGHFCEPHPRNYCVPHQQVPQIYNQCTVVNDYNYRNRTVVNNGVSVTVIGSAYHHPIQAVPIGTLTNPGRHGSPNQRMDHSARPFGANTSGGTVAPQPGSMWFLHDGTPQNQGAIAATIYHPPADERPAQNQSMPANNPAFERTPARHEPIAPGAFHQSALPYASPGTGSSAHYAAPPAGTQRLSISADPRGMPGQVNAQTSIATPPAVVLHSPRNEPRQGYVQLAPRTVSPVVASTPAPAQNQVQYPAPNNGGRTQGWQNH